MTRFRFKMKGEYVIGSLSIPTSCGTVNVHTVGGTKSEALMRAATIAQRISEDPVMAALMPPQAQAAIVASKALATAARQGAPALKRLWRKIKGPGKKRLAEALAKEAVKEDVSGGSRYQTSYKGVRLTNRGAWQEWQDPHHEGDDDSAEGYEESYSDIELAGRRKRRRKRKERARREREAYGDDAPVDEPQDAAPVDEPQDEAPTDNEAQS